MLRIHFASDDLARTRLAEGPDPMWELCISLHRLQRRDVSVLFGAWRRQVVPNVPASTRVLSALAPGVGYSCDFLTPRTGVDLLDQTQALRATPRSRLRDDLEAYARLNPRRCLPRWAGELADGRARLLELIGDAAERYFTAGLAPYWQQIRTQVSRDLQLRTRTLATAGWDAVFTTLHTSARWSYPVLELDYPVDQDMRLGGRGLLLQPSFFCRYAPTALFDPSYDPVLVYPIEHQPDWASSGTATDGQRPLIALLGRARASLLQAVAEGPGNTTELARRTGLTLSNTSRHLTALREASLTSNQRHHSATLHSVTGLGIALLNGTLPQLPT
ncbi:ArsR family transcriptional regulator [Streptomyces sp. NPDC003032]